MMKRILAAGPHPDDVEGGMGGAHLSVYMVYMEPAFSELIGVQYGEPFASKEKPGLREIRDVV